MPRIKMPRKIILGHMIVWYMALHLTSSTQQLGALLAHLPKALLTLYKMDLLSQSIMTLLFIVIQSQMKTHIQNIKEVLIIQFDSIVMTAFIIEYIVVVLEEVGALTMLEKKCEHKTLSQFNDAIQHSVLNHLSDSFVY